MGSQAVEDLVMVKKSVDARIMSLLMDMCDLYGAAEGARVGVSAHLKAMDLMGEAVDIVREIDMDEDGDVAATVGHQIEEVLLKMVGGLPATAQGWAAHRKYVGTLEYLHYQLTQVEEEMKAIGVLSAE
jgi:hypothetical protein